MKNAHFIKVKLTVFTLLLLLIIGCKSEKSEWDKAKQSDSLVDVENFYKNYPTSIYLKDAQSHLIEVKQTLAFNKADKTNTVEAYELFLKEFPESKYAEKAKITLGDLLCKTLVPDCVFIYWAVVFSKKADIPAYWHGALTNRLALNPDGPGLTIEFVPPDPNIQKLVVIIISNVGLKQKLESGNAYLWRGDDTFVYLKKIDIQNLNKMDFKKKETNEYLLNQVGLKDIGIIEYVYKNKMPF